MFEANDTSSDKPFSEFSPVLWKPDKERISSSGDIYSTLRNHGVPGEVIFHNLNDDLNQDLPFLDKSLLEYRINDLGYNIFTVRDFFEAKHSFSDSGIGNIVGDLGERIARRIVKYFLKHYSDDGHTGGIFDKRFNPKKKNGYIVCNTDNYVLKIQNYPNLIILRKEGEQMWEYNNIKELDGLFDYRYKGERHILVLESKLDKIQLDRSALVDNLFVPLRQLFPEAHFHYVLFSSSNALFKKIGRYRVLRDIAVDISKDLKEIGVGTLFFAFNEKRELFTQMANHLITQYLRIGYQDVSFDGRIVMNSRSIALYDEGENPFIMLERDTHNGLWREIVIM